MDVGIVQRDFVEDTVHLHPHRLGAGHDDQQVALGVGAACGQTQTQSQVDFEQYGTRHIDQTLNIARGIGQGRDGQSVEHFAHSGRPQGKTPLADFKKYELHRSCPVRVQILNLSISRRVESATLDNSIMLAANSSDAAELLWAIWSRL